MGKSNKSAKEELIRLYGKECFIEKLHLRPDTERKYTGKAQYHRMKQLTYHHIREKSKGGKATVENGALLSAENHEWFNKQSKEKQRELNNAFQEYKHRVDIHCATLVLKDKDIEIEPLQETEETIELPSEIERGYIELEPMTPEEQAKYEEYKKKKIAEKYKKFGVETAEQKREREQKQLLEDLELEFNERNRGGYGR